MLRFDMTNRTEDIRKVKVAQRVGLYTHRISLSIYFITPA